MMHSLDLKIYIIWIFSIFSWHQFYWPNCNLVSSLLPVSKISYVLQPIGLVTPKNEHKRAGKQCRHVAIKN
jgi:hypothetical protein